MTYASGQPILASDYNNFANRVNLIWGGGSGDFGYGQGSALSTVSIGTPITALQWTNLLNRMNTIRLHQTGAWPSTISNPSSGQQIGILGGGTVLNDRIFTTLTDNRLSNGGVGHAVYSGFGIQNGTSFTGERNLSIRIQFAGAAQMRYFFNTGGLVDWTAANSGFGGNTKSNDMLTESRQLGVVRIAAQYSTWFDAGYGLSLDYADSNKGFYDLGTGWSLITRNPSGTYGGNTVESYARLDNVPGSSSNLYVRIRWNDNADGVGSFDDTVIPTGNLAYLNGTVYRTNTNYVGDSWGTISFFNDLTA